jgi:HEAT repeat protein
MARLSSVFLVLITILPCVASAEARRRPAPVARQEVTDEMVTRLQGQNVDDVLAAVREIQNIGGPRAVAELMALLRSGPPDAVTQAAIEGLGALADPSSIDLLSEYSRHRRAAVRVLALQSLAAMHDARVEAVLTEALRDSNEEVRSTAAQSLGEGGYVESVSTLFQAFERGLREACAAIGKLGDPAASERLTGYLGRGDLPTLLEGLGEFVSRANFDMDAKLRIVERLLELAGPEVRRFLVQQLAEVPGTPANRRLREAMEAAIAQIPEGN